MPDPGKSDYERGHTAGEIAAKLDRHDEHFRQINGSIDRTAEAIEGLRLDVQRLFDQGEADARTRVTTAAALKEAVDTRRGSIARTIALVGSAVAVASLALAVYLATR